MKLIHCDAHDVFHELQMSISSTLLRAKRHCLAEEPEIPCGATFDVLIHITTVSPCLIVEFCVQLALPVNTANMSQKGNSCNAANSIGPAIPFRYRVAVSPCIIACGFARSVGPHCLGPTKDHAPSHPDGSHGGMKPMAAKARELRT